MVIELAAKSADLARVFTFGVGSDCDKRLVGDIAKAGRGTASFVFYYEELNACVIEALSKASEPSLKEC